MALTLILGVVAAGLLLLFLCAFIKNVKAMTAKQFPDDYWEKMGVKEPSFPGKDNSWAGNSPWSAFVVGKHHIADVVIK